MRFFSFVVLSFFINYSYKSQASFKFMHKAYFSSKGVSPLSRVKKVYTKAGNNNQRSIDTLFNVFVCSSLSFYIPYKIVGYVYPVDQENSSNSVSKYKLTEEDRMWIEFFSINH